ncbi:hypothetical protein scyTo_0008719 [Scyliorhinus torazame]|uniref:Uncharacterized protein n=1 Tax=Scyliorhinus torazame TaxID=75743 RepID=A0A401PCS2_SCYTO|nr:hypothetical protein [Scyliorhinus torazame]
MEQASLIHLHGDSHSRDFSSRGRGRTNDSPAYRTNRPLISPGCAARAGHGTTASGRVQFNGTESAVPSMLREHGYCCG